MAIYKNKASQKAVVYAYDSTDGSPKTGDAANITGRISKDGGASAATDDVNPTELDATHHPGAYVFDLTQAETNADLVVLSASSTTADILIEPLIVYTQPERRDANLQQWRGAEPNVLIDGRPDVNVQAGVAPIGTAMRGTDAAMLASSAPTNWSNMAIDGSGNVTAGSVVSAVATDSASREASKADVTGLSTHSAADVWSVGTRTLTSFGTLVADVATAVWTAATRTLSAFGFAVATDSASREASKADVSDLSTLDEADVRAALGMAAANLDAQLAAIDLVTGRLGTMIEDEGGWRYTAAALAEAPAGEGGGLSGTDAVPEEPAEGTVFWHLSRADVLTSSVVSGAGSGAYGVTVTVQADGTPLEGARVRLTEGATSLVVETDASGEATFAVDAATWAVAVTKPGYQHGPTTHAVSADAATHALAVTMTAVTLPAAESAELCRVSVYVVDAAGSGIEGETVTFALTALPDDYADGRIHAGTTTADTDADGLAYADVVRGARIGIVHAGRSRPLLVPDAESVLGPSFLGGR
jgi:hypothetical protein